MTQLSCLFDCLTPQPPNKSVCRCEAVTTFITFEHHGGLVVSNIVMSLTCVYAPVQVTRVLHLQEGPHLVLLLSTLNNINFVSTLSIPQLCRIVR